MGINYLEFDDMYNYFEENIDIKLIDAIDKWKEVKDIGKDTMLGWKELLNEVTRDLIDHGYSIETAKRDAWKQYYESIAEDSIRWQFKILDLEEEFFNSHKNYSCRSCGWFSWDYRNESGYSNNFSVIRKSKNSRCISEVE